MPPRHRAFVVCTLAPGRLAWQTTHTSRRTSGTLARFLWYYRLVGVVLFELFEARALLFVFANVFEYFFIAYEIVRLKWDPRRMSRSAVLWTAALIWVCVKLPQEWWIHIAQLDFTDFVKETVFGSDADDGWSAAFGNRPIVSIALLAALAGLVALALWGRRRLPTPDWSMRFDVDRPLPADVPSTSTSVIRDTLSV